MSTDHSDDTHRRLGRRAFLGLSALAAGGAALGGLDTVSGAPATERLFRTPRWSAFRSMLPTDDGFLLTGIRTNSANEQVGWGLRLDADLEVRWNRAYLSPSHLRSTDRGENHDGIEFALPYDDGGFLLVGWWHALGSDSRYGWLTRVGADGIPWWSGMYNRDGVNSFRDDFADGVVTDDGFLLVGRSIGDEFLDRRNGDGWIVEISRGRRGQIQWQRAYDPAGTSDGFADDRRHAELNAVVSVDDGYLAVGEASPDGPTESTTTAAWALRIDGDGDQQWSRTYRLDQGQHNEFRDVAVVDDGFLVAGVVGAEESVTELHDYEMRGRSWAAKLDGQGRVIWQDAPGGDGFSAVEPAGNGGVFVGRRDGRGWVVAYDEDGGRVGSDRSSTAGSDYCAVATRGQGSGREYLSAGYGRGGGSTNGLLSQFPADDIGGDDGDSGDNGDERLLEIVATESGEVRYEFTVDGDVSGVRVNDRIKAENNDDVQANDDGTVTVSGYTGNAGYGDAFRVTGEITGFESSGDTAFFLRLDGERVSVDELLGADDDGGDGATRLFEIVATEMGAIRYELTVDGEVTGVRLTDRIKAENDDRIEQNDDGTVTVSGSTGNTGYGDAFRVTGEITGFESSGDTAFFLRLDGERVGVDELVDD